MSAVELLLPRLESVRQTGPNRWIARCPGHEDHSPSLSIREVDDRVLVHCFAGCSAADVMVGVGLGLSDLYDQPLEHHRRGRKHPSVDYKGLCYMARRAATIVWLFSHDAVNGKQPDPEDMEIVNKAHRDLQMFLRALDTEFLGGVG